MMSLNGLHAAGKFILGMGSGADAYFNSKLGMITLCITANVLYWPHLMLFNCDCRKPTRIGWFTQLWLKHGFFGRTSEELEMGAIAIYQNFYMAIQHLNVVGMCAASRIPGFTLPVEDTMWWQCLLNVLFIVQIFAMILNKWAFILIGLNTVSWVDMFCRRKLCPYVQQFPFSTWTHPMFWTGALCYYGMQITPNGISLYGLFHVTVNSFGNWAYLRFFEEPFIKWFFIDKVPIDELELAHNG